MTDRIEPALTPQEWVDASGSEYSEATVRLGGSVMAWFDAGDLLIAANGDGDEVHRPEVLIALANAALPDSDPRKITREWVTALRDLAKAIEAAHGSKMIGAVRVVGPAGSASVSLGDDFGAMADALESYLPPE